MKASAVSHLFNFIGTAQYWLTRPGGDPFTTSFPNIYSTDVLTVYESSFHVARGG